jgi:hypothetical protein
MRVYLLCAIVIIAAQHIVAGEHNYIGVAKCAKMCHKSEKKGAQLKKWKNGPHAKAYKTLANEHSKKVAAEKGIKGDPQKASECLKCHVTAFGVKASRIDSTFEIEDGVQCEACHGPGKDYRKLSIMKDRKKAVAAGLILQNAELCIKCHNKESPTYIPFKYEEKVKKIAHPTPKK